MEKLVKNIGAIMLGLLVVSWISAYLFFAEPVAKLLDSLGDYVSYNMEDQQAETREEFFQEYSWQIFDCVLDETPMTLKFIWLWLVGDYVVVSVYGARNELEWDSYTLEALNDYEKCKPIKRASKVISGYEHLLQSNH